MSEPTEWKTDWEINRDYEINFKLAENEKRDEIKKFNKKLEILYGILAELGFPLDIQKIIAVKLYNNDTFRDVPKKIKFTENELIYINPNHDFDKWLNVYK